jgi:hypothetical protein
MNSIKILILIANPNIPDFEPLQVYSEAVRIDEAIKRSKHRDRFQVVIKPAVGEIELQRALVEEQPQIVHFAGHGAGEHGLVLEDDAGKMKFVGTDALEQLFGIFDAGEIECVLLNACYSEEQAVAIHQSVDCVIGMNRPIGDQAAIRFSEGFYDALGAGRDYDTAFNLGRSAINLAGSSEYLTPVLKYRKRKKVGLSATQESAEKDPQPRVEPTAAYNPIQPPEQSITITGSTISGPVGQAGRDVIQIQHQSQGESMKQLSPSEVVQLINQIEDLLRSSTLSPNQQNKIFNYLETAKDQASSQKPDKDFAAKSLQMATSILKETSETINAGQSLWDKFLPLLGRLLPWLGVSSHFFGL